MSSGGHNSRSGPKPSGKSHPATKSPSKRYTSKPNEPDSASQTNGEGDFVLRTTIPSISSASREVQQRILEAVEQNGFTPHSFFAVKLALEEGMVNAIKHGNRQDAKKHVHIEAHVTPKLADISIEDEGPGFDRSAVPDPTTEENREKCSGRGILLIESYMNSVEWSQNGRRIRMIKRNGEEPGIR
jgi:serine/threonine-protein kinase RsbW